MSGHGKVVTVELDRDRPVDLVAFAGVDGFLLEREGAGIAGRGAAARVDVAQGLAGGSVGAAIAAVLDDLDVADEVGRPGTGPIAVGALPFDSTEPAQLVVPEVVVGQDEAGRQWLTTVGSDIDPASLPDACPTAPEAPDGFALSSPVSHAAWRALVNDALDAIAAGDLEKVVLAREVLVDTNRPISRTSVLDRLRALYPSCWTFAVEGFVGASPELLVQRQGHAVTSHPLAGTFAHTGDPATDAEVAFRMLGSQKERWEHELLVAAVKDTLAPHCDELDVPADPTLMALRNVVHLGTPVRGTLRRPSAHVIDLVAALHPTPAVGGTPEAAALEWINCHEPLERGPYAGPVGWADRNGDGEWVVGIRSALLGDGPNGPGRRARLFAGGGIVAGSDPDAELAETQLKLQALLAALVRP